MNTIESLALWLNYLIIGVGKVHTPDQ